MQIVTYYLVLKALHIAFMVTWFAGLFYLPRLFIYHAAATDQISLDRFVLMERRLFIIMSIGAVRTARFGVLLLIANPALLNISWFQIKLALLLILITYHFRCLRRMKRLADGVEIASSRWLRLFNEIPTLWLLWIVCLAMLKPK